MAYIHSGTPRQACSSNKAFSPKRVQALLGHSTIQMTFDVYGHLFSSVDGDQVAFGQLQARLLVA